MQPTEQNLIDYLKDEFKRHPEVRLSVSVENGVAGVSVRTKARTYFFPFEWSPGNGFREVQSLVKQIMEILPDRG